MHRKWFVQKTNPEYVSYLAGASSVSPAFAQVLINRGMKTPEDVSSFLDPSKTEMCDPFSLDGMESVVEALEKARASGTKVLIHGDYDCDGITATAIMVEAFRAYGLQVEYFVPNRFDHGYGFNLPGLEHAKQVGAGLIVTVDCGITSFEASEAARNVGIGLVITDHHEPHIDADGKMVLPEALAIINPKLKEHDEDTPLLSGAGVALCVTKA
ncbi:hypothetical protein LCGC14_2090250, partial [marine sediment metagenome]